MTTATTSKENPLPLTGGGRKILQQEHYKWMLADCKKSLITESDIERLGWGPCEKGYKIPYIDPATGEPMLTPDGQPFTRIRLRNPKNGCKYLSPKKGGIRCFIPPDAHEAITKTPGLPLFLTEGEKKALCATKFGLPTVGLGGIWNWLEKGKTDALNADLIPYLKGGRDVVLIYDSDATETPKKTRQFADCARRLACALEPYGCKLYRFDLPKLEGNSKVGLDDYIAANHGDTSELRNLIDSQKTLVIPEKAAPGAAITETDTGNARRLVQIHGENIKFVHEAKQWFVWTGRNWNPDNANKVMAMTGTVSDAIRKEAFALDTSTEEAQKKQVALIRWANASLEERRRLSAMRLAAAEPGMTVSIERFDAESWLLNCKNGTLDLRSGKLHNHDRAELLTHLLPIDYNPGAPAPRWLRFIDEIFAGDKSLVGFMQRAIGYSLTGDISEQVCFILHGFGANGKSTMLKTIAKVMGGLARHSDIETFTERDTGRIPEDRARLRGARFVTTSETGRGHRLDESFVKDLSGGEPVTARFLHQNSFEFQPCFKLFMACNHKPGITGTDHGIWRRIRLVPFTQKFDPRKEPDLEFTLEKELAGILAWAVEGCKLWQDQGLGLPDAVKAATESYRSESDLIGLFLDESCTLHECLTAAASDLYRAYRDWADNGGYRAMNQRNFGMGLRERGFERFRSGATGAYHWRGLAIN